MRDDNHDLFSKRQSSNKLLDELGSLKALLDEELEATPPAYSSLNEVGSVEEYLRLKQAAQGAGLTIEAYLERQATVEPELEEEPYQTLELVDDEDEIPLLDAVITLDAGEHDTVHHDGDALLLDLAEEEEEGRPAPTSAEVTTVEDYFRAVAAAKHRDHLPPRQPAAPRRVASPLPVVEPLPPLLDEVVAAAPAPTLDEEITLGDGVPQLDEVVTAEVGTPLLDEVIAIGDNIPLLEEVAPADEAVESGAMSLEEVQELVDLIVKRKLERLKPELEQEVMGELQRLLPLSTLTGR